MFAFFSPILFFSEKKRKKKKIKIKKLRPCFVTLEYTLIGNPVVIN